MASNAPPAPPRPSLRHGRLAAFAVCLASVAALAAAYRSDGPTAPGFDPGPEADSLRPQQGSELELASSDHIAHLFGLPPDRILAHVDLTPSERSRLDDPSVRDRCQVEVAETLEEYRMLSSMRDELALNAAREQVEAGTFRADARSRKEVGEGATEVHTPMGRGFVHHAEYPELGGIALRLRELPARLESSLSAHLASE